MLTSSTTKIIELYGEHGVGKKAVAKAAAGYLQERSHFLDGIIIVKYEAEKTIFDQIIKFIDPEIKTED